MREEATRWLMTHRGLQQRAKEGSGAIPAVGRGDGGGAVAAAALGRQMWLGQWSRVLAPVGRLVVASPLTFVLVPQFPF